MKRLTLACLLLSFCASSSVAGPAPQSNRQTSGESKCSAGFKECQESLNDFKEAEQFMQLKATVLADLDRLEKSRPTKPKNHPCSRSRCKSPENWKRRRLQCHRGTEYEDRFCASHERSPAGIVGVCRGDSRL